CLSGDRAGFVGPAARSTPGLIVSTAADPNRCGVAGLPDWGRSAFAVAPSMGAGPANVEASQASTATIAATARAIAGVFFTAGGVPPAAGREARPDRTSHSPKCHGPPRPRPTE